MFGALMFGALMLGPVMCATRMSLAALAGILACVLSVVSPVFATEVVDGRAPDAAIATVLIYRLTSVVDLGLPLDVHAAERKVCRLNAGHCCEVEVPVGEVEIWSSNFGKGSVTLDVHAGRQHYVRVGVTKGVLFLGRPHLVEVVERVGRAESAACQRETSQP